VYFNHIGGNVKRILDGSGKGICHRGTEDTEGQQDSSGEFNTKTKNSV
jgi:hypothetical protein